MIFGFIRVNKNAVETHRDSYRLANLSVVSVRRPYLAGAMLLGSAFTGFGFAFGDLLYTGEIISITGLSLAAIIAGSQVGQLSLLSRDLKGTELSGAVWGRHSSLQLARRKIVEALHETSMENTP
ncbi:MAG: hypothetical protein GY762_02395 [Proteobacteria bacterium]|nr:hypothetical protein [Pseudomonadota bacterium]